MSPTQSGTEQAFVCAVQNEAQARGADAVERGVRRQQADQAVPGGKQVVVCIAVAQGLDRVVEVLRATQVHGHGGKLACRAEAGLAVLVQVIKQASTVGQAHGLVHVAHGAQGFQPERDHRGQREEGFVLLEPEVVVRDGIDQAQGAQDQPFAADELGTSVEADVR